MIKRTIKTKTKIKISKIRIRKSKRQSSWTKTKNKAKTRKNNLSLITKAKMIYSWLSRKSQLVKIRTKIKRDLNPLRISSSQTNKPTKLSHQTKEFWLKLIQPKTRANKLLRKGTKPKTTWKEPYAQRMVNLMNKSPYLSQIKSNPKTLRNPRSRSRSFKSTRNTLSKINKISNSPPTTNPPPHTKKLSKPILEPESPTKPKSPTNPNPPPITKNPPATITTCPTS